MSPPPKVLMVSRALPFHGAGGMESVAWDLARALARLGCAVTVLTTEAPGLVDRSSVEGVAIRMVAASPRRYSPEWWRGSLDVYRASLADTEVILSVSAAANAIVTAKGRARGPVAVFQAHGTSSGEFLSKLRSGSPRSMLGSARNLYWGLFKDGAYRRYDALVAVGAPVLRQLTQLPTRLLVAGVSVHLILNGVDQAQFGFDAGARARVRGALGLPLASRVMLSIARLHPQKGFMPGLEAFAAAHRQAPDLRWLIVGEGPLRAELEAAIVERALGDSVRLVGPAARAEVPGYLSAADALLFPTLRVEGLPVSVLEALASGLPVITSRSGADAALPVVRVDPRDPVALAGAIAAACPSGLDRPTLLPAAFTLDHMAGAYIALFQALKAAPG
jgi:glycosyltransferase involved in cell wall biosynthesis